MLKSKPHTHASVSFIQTDLLAFLGCAIIALLIDLGHFHRMHHGDSIVPIMVSWFKWTPFFWKQDRYGMLLALLAKPIAHPFIKLLCMEWMSICGSLSAQYMVIRYALPGAYATNICFLSIASMIALVSKDYFFELTSTSQFFSLPLAVMLVAFFLVRKRTFLYIAAAACLSIVACWLSIATPLIVASLMLTQFDHWRVVFKKLSPLDYIHHVFRSRLCIEIGLLLWGGCFGLYIKKQAIDQQISFHLLPMHEFFYSFLQNAQSTLKQIGRDNDIPWCVVFWTMCIMVSLPQLAHKKQRLAIKSIILLMLSAGAYGAIVASQSYTKWMGFHSRFFMPSTMIFHIACVACLLWLYPYVRAYLLLIVTCMIVLLQYGLPSIQGVRRDIDEKMGQRTASLLASDADYFAGDYWTVWPAVYHANLTLYEQHNPRRIWPITHRGDELMNKWKLSDDKKMHVFMLPEDKKAKVWLSAFHLLQE